MLDPETLFAVWDVETTGLDPEKDRVVEVAAVLCSPTQILGRQSSLVNPEMKIPSQASAIHHLTNKHVDSAPLFGEAMKSFKSLMMEPPAAYVAHKVDNDSAFIPLKRAPWVCTLRLARKLLPELKAHNLQFLRYELGLDVPDDVPVHRAEGDAYVTAKLLQHLLKLVPTGINGTEALAAFANEPIILVTVAFGKHKDKKWSEVPKDYLRWLSEQPGFNTKDRDLRDTVNHYLGAARVRKPATDDDDPF